MSNKFGKFQPYFYQFIIDGGFTYGITANIFGYGYKYTQKIYDC